MVSPNYDTQIVCETHQTVGISPFNYRDWILNFIQLYLTFILKTLAHDSFRQRDRETIEQRYFH